ncbi:hypothetical protein L332_03515 [Agrococcus pavilionensis RW1]|uniref:Helix-turn-helix domain-containing protein n=1 Tax=Agrococcus pavilionensis RW1 TaxID=1330458 RepID=U1LNH8_9MICO|nr:hypothetical protein [Agrococcus pavilionensis]ERG63522.1 hypothetical protein L332_03515 [Agrococcus pavilionensis RW1]
MREKWLTYPQAAARAGVTMRQVRRWRSAGLAGRIGEQGRWEVEEQALMAWARRAAFSRVQFGEHVQPRRDRTTTV